jgi:molybdopterin-guanine dinucleotide biosynthesis protein A
MQCHAFSFSGVRRSVRIHSLRLNHAFLRADPPMRPTFNALLLAGGTSSRMGRPKALLTYEGVPLWRLQADRLRALAPRELLISTRPELPLERGPWTIIHDRQTGLGPLAGIEAALLAASADFLIVLAVDMPAMTTGFLRKLLDRAGPRGVVPQLEDRYQGLAAIYPAHIWVIVQQILASADRSLQQLVRLALAAELVTIYPVGEDERGLFQNLNQPADLREVNIRTARRDTGT